MTPPEVRWVTPMSVCHDCGHRFKRHGPFSGTPRKDGARYGSSYCRACLRRRCAASMARPVRMACSYCGSRFTGAMRMFWHVKYGGRAFCSHPCRVAQMRADFGLPVDRVCQAPVPGGCGRLACSNRGEGYGRYCQGHAKRRERGRPIDTPINERQSAANKASRARMVSP